MLFRSPLSQQKEFRSIKNAVIQEAENIRMGKVTFEDEEMEKQELTSDLPHDCWELWMVTQDDTAPMADSVNGKIKYTNFRHRKDTNPRHKRGQISPRSIPGQPKAAIW